MAGSLGLGLSGWAAWTTHTLMQLLEIAKSRPTFDDVKSMIANDSPYKRDESMLKRQLHEIEVNVSGMSGKVDKIHDYFIIARHRDQSERSNERT